MSLKAELETWAAALKAYDEEDFEKSLDLFSRIADSSKILTNMGLIYATLGEHEAAVERFIEATTLDNYLAVAYFQCGVSNFLLARYDLAYKDFEEALLYLRGNQAINYEQLGLKFRLFSAEVLFNKGLSQIYLGRMDEGLRDMEEARADKATDEHNVIDDAIRDRGEGYTVFSIPVGVLYRPSEKKLKNSTTKDYMGKAKLIAASDSGDAFTTFTGVTRMKAGITPTGVYAENGGDPSTGAPVSAPLPKPSGGDAERGTGLMRSKTTLNVPGNDREPQRATSDSGLTPGMNRSMSLARGPGIGGPVRGLSIRKPATSPTTSAPPPPNKDNRMTDFYDDYLDSYTEAPPPLPTGGGGSSDRIAQWAQKNANPGSFSPMRSGSRSAPTSQYAPSSYGGGVRRRTTRRAPSSRGRIQSSYEEEEEGYVSGEYEDGPFELIKIRVKLYYRDDVRGMALTPETPFEEFVDKVTAKFGKRPDGLMLRFKDEDGGKVSLRDESDYELAIETARESSKGRPEGRLEVWCEDV